MNNGTQKCLCLPDYGGLICQSCKISKNSPCFYIELADETFTHRIDSLCGRSFSSNKSMLKGLKKPVINCEFIDFKCETNPCMNGATCFLNELHQTSCICPHGLTGNYCQTGLFFIFVEMTFKGLFVFFLFIKFMIMWLVLDCNCHPCLNGGSCIMTNGTAKCLCTSDYDGILCQTGICFRGLLPKLKEL